MPREALSAFQRQGSSFILFLSLALIKGVGYTSGGFAVFVTPVYMTEE